MLVLDVTGKPNQGCKLTALIDQPASPAGLMTNVDCRLAVVFGAVGHWMQSCCITIIFKPHCCTAVDVLDGKLEENNCINIYRSACVK